MKAPDLPEEKPSARDKADYTGAADFLADSIKSRLQSGDVVAATDFPECDRPLFWSAIVQVRDELPSVKPAWRTVSEQHVDGRRVRQKMFRICPRQQVGQHGAPGRTESLDRSIRHRADVAAGMSSADKWRTAHRAALEIKNCCAADARHKAVSALLAQLSSLLGSAGRK